MTGNNLKEIWNLAMDSIKQEYAASNQENEFELWFNLKYIEDDINTIKASVPSDFMWNSMKSKGNVAKVISKIKEISGFTNDIVIEPVINNTLIYTTSENTDSKKEPKVSIPKNENKSSEQNISDFKTESFSSRKVINSTLDEKFTFQNFITGEGTSSNFAYKVAMDVAENPGLKRNPILLYGGCGLGKTHLMQAIGNRILEKYGDEKKICYIQAENFLNEFTNSMFKKNQSAFVAKYRKLDVLLLDDIHFLQGKSGIQDELFYTFEALHKNKSQMVFTCDRPLKEIENMAERLVSRLGSGMCLNLDFPGFETRKAIVYKKLESKNIKLSDEIITLIAQTVETNIRDLEAAIEKITGYAEFITEDLSIEVVKSLLSDFYSAPKVGNITISNIFKVVAENFQISVADIKSKKKEKKYVIPRHIALYLGYNLAEYTFSELGSECGGRDHTSIMHACEKVESQIKTDPSFKQKINFIIKEIKEYKN